MSDKKKGRAKGSKVKSYTYKVEWKADEDGLATLESAIAFLESQKIRIGKRELIQLALEQVMTRDPETIAKLAANAVITRKNSAVEAKKLAKIAALRAAVEKAEKNLNEAQNPSKEQNND